MLEVLLTDPKGRCYEYWIAEDDGRERRRAGKMKEKNQGCSVPGPVPILKDQHHKVQYCIVWGKKRRQETFRVLAVNIPSILSVLVSCCVGWGNQSRHEVSRHNLKVQVSPASASASTNEFECWGFWPFVIICPFVCPFFLAAGVVLPAVLAVRQLKWQGQVACGHVDG
jgi:hypothetical protein